MFIALVKDKGKHTLISKKNMVDVKPLATYHEFNLDLKGREW